MEKISVLIVDDNLEFCEILSEFCITADNLELCGVAHDGIEGLEKISRLSPDVVILDIIMPHMDGLSMLEALKDYPAEKKNHTLSLPLQSLRKKSRTPRFSLVQLTT